MKVLKSIQLCSVYNEGEPNIAQLLRVQHTCVYNIDHTHTLEHMCDSILTDLSSHNPHCTYSYSRRSNTAVEQEGHVTRSTSARENYSSTTIGGLTTGPTITYLCLHYWSPRAHLGNTLHSK